MAATEISNYRPIEYRIESSRPFTAQQQDRRIGQTADQLIETARLHDIYLSPESEYESSSMNGKVHKRLVRTRLVEKNSRVEVILASEDSHRAISFRMSVKSAVPEAAYAALEKVLYDRF